MQPTLERLMSSGNEQHLLQLKGNSRLLGNRKMANMDWVEGAAEQSNPW
jgi:hypothetical protein